jgi:uncharacterized damage-inducible protein DinB
MGWYDLQRAIIHHKCEGLSDEDARRAVLPTSPLMTMAGIVYHLRWVEHSWFEALFLNRPSRRPGDAEGEHEDADMMPGDIPLSQLLDEYQQQCAISNEIIAAHDLGETGRNTEYKSAAASLRWMIIHMIEETARHAGHADAIRELIDGRTSYY